MKLTDGLPSWILTLSTLISLFYFKRLGTKALVGVLLFTPHLRLLPIYLSLYLASFDYKESNLSIIVYLGVC